METNEGQHQTAQKKSISYFKFLISLPILRLAYKTLIDIPDTGSARGIALILWGIIFLMWGVLWFVKLPNLSAVASIQKIADNPIFKKIVKWVMILLVLIAIFFTIMGVFDDFIPGFSGKDFFTIMLAPVLH